MKKRIWTTVLALLLTLGTFQTAAFAASETEPNNDQKSASKIQLNTAITASINNGDEDWYQITLDQPGFLKLSAEHPAERNLYAHIHQVGASGKLERIFEIVFPSLSNSVNDIISGQSDRIGLPEGNYYIKLSSWCSNGNPTGNYTLSAEFTAVTGGTLELEMNNEFKTATPIQTNKVIRASLIKVDIDWYKISIKEPDAMRLSVEYPSSCTIFTTVYAVDGSGTLKQIGTKTLSRQKDSVLDTLTGSSETIGVAAGDYYIKIQKSSDDNNLSTEYSLKIELDSTTPSEWAQESVNAAIAAGLVPENLQKNYTQPISRSNMAQMLINLIEKSSEQTIDNFLAGKGVGISKNAFSDTTDKAVLAANALGILSGVGGDRFDPNGTLTRGQIAAIISRTARVLGVNTEGYTHSFTDVSGHWASTELGWPVHTGVITGIGDNRFDPDGKLTTEQAIAITYRAMNAL